MRRLMMSSGPVLMMLSHRNRLSTELDYQPATTVSTNRFMLTEERREKNLLRRRKSSLETDEQLLHYLNNKRISQLNEFDNYLNKGGFTKISEDEEAKMVEDRISSYHLPQEVLNEDIDKSEVFIEPSDCLTAEDYCMKDSSISIAWEEISDSKGESSSSDTYIPNKFFVNKKSDEAEQDVKPPIYRNINVAYEFKSRLKKGTYTIVNRYFSRIRKIDVAIKVIPKIGLSDKRLFKFVPREQDLAAEKKFKHPNIVKFIETYETGLRIYIMMEYVDKGNLSEYIKARGRLDPVTYRTFFNQLINAVNYCFDYGICHRKLSTDNCLVTSNFVLKLCDFSYCRNIKNRNELLNTHCGVLGFTAPEILMCRDYQPNMTEAWSCGVILFTMIYGALPFDSSSFPRLLKQVMKPIKYQWYCDTPIDAIMIMYQSISPIDRRWSIQKILGHSWVTPPSTEGYENYMKWYKKRTRGPSVPVVRKKLIELMELIKRDYVIPLNEKQEKMYQATEEASEQETPIDRSVKDRIRLCEMQL